MSAPYYADDQVTLHHGDALEVLRTLPGGSVDSCVTSPPYFGLRDYGEPRQYGLEATPAEYVETMRTLFAEVRRVLTDDGTLWLNIGDSYPSRSDGFRRGDTYHPAQPISRRRVDGEVPKSLRGMPWRVAFALQDDGWILRNDNIWRKTSVNGRPIRDRFVNSHEYVFLFAKQRFYYFDEQMAPMQDVWDIAPESAMGAHEAPMPAAVAERCILAGCKPRGTVLDPFSGSGTTGMVAQRHGRRYVGIDLNRDYLDLSLRTRLQQAALDFEGGDAA